MTQDAVTTIDLLRHGEPQGGVRYRGALDDPLSERGWAQMRAAVGQHCPWQTIVSSPLQRCAAFARSLAEQHALPLEIEPGLHEMRFGAWEGRTPTEIMATTPAALERFWRDPLTYPPPEGESLPDCKSRVVAAWQALLARHVGNHVLVVGHGGMIRLVLCHILEIPLQRLWRLEVPYATLSRIRIHGVSPTAEPLLVFHGKGLE
jgi:alpha-ribazole phosphatase